jgi:dethiobiotin synthetase
MTRRPCGVFVTGTDTGVGKTVVTATLALSLKSQDVKTGIMKPIETGADGSGLSDSEWLSGVTDADGPRDLTTPYRFRTSAAPLVAASAEGAAIDPQRIVAAFQALSARYDCLLVEGIGGVMVPITKEFFVVDLIGMMQLSVLIVSPVSLGSINHSLLTVHALHARGISVLGFIFNNSIPPQTDAEIHRTIPTILQITGLRSFGELPYCRGLPQTWEQHHERLVAQIDIEGLLEALGLRRAA